MKWTRQGDAVVGAVRLTDGVSARVVLVGPRTNPKGAVVVIPVEGPEKVKTLNLHEALERLNPQDVVETLCLQERLFGASGLAIPKIS